MIINPVFNRYLHKVFSQQLSMAQLPIDISYLASDYPKNRRCPAMASVQFSHHNILLEAYRQRARRYPHVIATVV